MSPPIRILELRSVRGTGGGPEKTILMGARASDPRRFLVTVCYLRDQRDRAFGVTTRAESVGVSDYVELLERHSFDPSIWFKLRRLIDEREIQIVHSHDYKTNLLAWLLRRFTGIAVLSTVHGYTGNSSRELRCYYPCDKRLLARFPRAIAVSTDIKNELIRHGARADRVTTILNGIDDKAFQRDRTRQQEVRASLDLSADDIVIGSVGRLEPQKRFDLLLRAFASLRAKRPALKLLIAGDGSLLATLKAQSRELGLTGSCRFLGQVSDIVRLHHAFDLYVQSSDYEGTPNAVLEAMALETPVVATDVGGTSELMADGLDGLVIPPGDVAALTAGIEQLLQNRSHATAMATAARRRVERELSFASRMQKVEAIYDELVPSSGHTEALVVPVPEQLQKILKGGAHVAAWCAVTPSVVSFALRRRLFGADRAIEGSTQAWALVPGLAGQYLRRAFLSRALTRCARTATIEFGTIFSSASATIDEFAYIGPRCHIGWAHIERDVLVAAGVHIPSGLHTHGTDDLSTPMRDQPGQKQPVRIERGAWIGSAAIVMADVGRDTIVGAGAVVTRALPDRVVAAGVPARVVRTRQAHPLRLEA